jgi:hypothetical protein
LNIVAPAKDKIHQIQESNYCRVNSHHVFRRFSSR